MYTYIYYHYVTHSIYLNRARTFIIMIQLVRYWLLLIENIWIFYFNFIHKLLAIHYPQCRLIYRLAHCVLQKYFQSS